MKNCVFRGRRAELHIPLATQKLGFAIEPCRTAIFMDFMKNDSLDSMENCVCTLHWYHEKLLSGKIS